MPPDTSAEGETATTSRLADRLAIAVSLAQRHAWATIALSMALTAVFGAYTAAYVGFNADPNALFSKELRFQKAIAEFEQHFPVLTNSILIVLDGETPERTRQAAEILVPALDAQRDKFYRAFQPGEDRFFERYGLLYSTPDNLDAFADHMAVVQPMLAQLAHAPTLPALAEAVESGLEAVGQGEVGDAGWDEVLDHLRKAAIAVRDGDTSPFSWEALLMRGTGFVPSTRTIVVAEPILEAERILAADRAIDAIRETAERLELTPDHGVELLLTGYPVLNHEEMIGLATDTTAAGVLSFILVVFVLIRAFASWRLVVAAAIALLTGLVWAAAFATASVRILNPVSVTLLVLVIGLGIDFMIHLGMHFIDVLAGGEDADPAMLAAVRDTGPALVLCAATTSVGFLAFVPTEFTGVSHLGMAAAGGMVIILVLTMSLFPALAHLLFRSNQAVAQIRNRGPARGLTLPLPRRPLGIIAGAGVLGLAALPLLPAVDLDTNVISFRNQQTESVRAFKELLTTRATTPWFLDALTPSLERADELAIEIENLDTVDAAVTLSDFLPTEQPLKTEILGDISLMLGLPPARARVAAPAAQQYAALHRLAKFLSNDPVDSSSPLAEPVADLGDALTSFVVDLSDPGDPRIGDFGDALLGPIPGQLSRLQASLDVTPIDRNDLPPGLVERMLADDGRARIQVYPSDTLWDNEAMVTFVESIRPIWGDITGLPVNLVESARATWESLRAALLWAALAIAAMLLVLWRQPMKAAIALGPLLLAVLLTQASTVALPISFNFANVIVLPLLLGIGVDSGIHLVERASSLRDRNESLLATTTARAVLFSAISTVVTFGTLMLSAHRGVSSLGVLLVVGMVWTLAANLVLLPALLVWRQKPETS